MVISWEVTEVRFRLTLDPLRPTTDTAWGLVRPSLHYLTEVGGGEDGPTGSPFPSSIFRASRPAFLVDEGATRKGSASDSLSTCLLGWLSRRHSSALIVLKENQVSPLP